MNKYEGVVIEQDRRNDQVFTFLVPEYMISALYLGNRSPKLIEDVEMTLERFKEDKAKEATAMFAGHEARKWIADSRCLIKSCPFYILKRGDFKYALVNGMAYSNSMWFVGEKVTFKERDKAMLFKLMFMNNQEAEAA